MLKILSSRYSVYVCGKIFSHASILNKNLSFAKGSVMKTKNGHAPPTEVHARHRNNVLCFKGAASYMLAQKIASYIVVICRLLRP